MSVVLEEIKDIQYITNNSGEKTAIIIPLEEKGESFRRLLTEFSESRSFNDVDTLIKLVKSIQTLTALISSCDDAVFLKEMEYEIEKLIHKIDEKIEDELDLIAIKERSDEETVTHKNLIESLKADGLI